MDKLSIQEQLLQTRINSFLKEKRSLKRVVGDYVLNKNFPIENRWMILEQSTFLRDLPSDILNSIYNGMSISPKEKEEIISFLYS